MLHGHGDDAFRYENIKMNFSSNIYSHADMSELKAFLATRLDTIDSYPEPEPYSLRKIIARKKDVDPECILVTNGATDAIYLIAQALKAMGNTTIEIANPTFSEYADACNMFGMNTVNVHIDNVNPETFNLSPESNDNVATWLCNPNNPTGRVYDNHTIRTLARKRRLLIIDQSYEEHTSKNILSTKEAVDCGNIIQIHSLTKTYAIPGLRIGYISAAKQIIEQLRRFMRPWAVNALAIEAAKWLLEHQTKAINDMNAYLKETQRLRERLSEIKGVDALPTETNFILARIDNITAAELKQMLAEKHNILIRDASNFETLDNHYIRIAAQRSDENDALVEAIRQCLHE